MGCCEGMLGENELLSNTPILIKDHNCYTDTPKGPKSSHTTQKHDELDSFHDFRPMKSPISHIPTIELPDNLSESSILSWKNLKF